MQSTGQGILVELSKKIDIIQTKIEALTERVSNLKGNVPQSKNIHYAILPYV